MFPLSVSGAEISVNSKRLVGPINLMIKQKGISVVLGANGSGKTTLLEALHGLRKLSKGKLEWSAPNSQAAEQNNALFDWLQTPSAFMIQESFMNFTRKFIQNVNFKKVSHLLAKLRCSR